MIGSPDSDGGSLSNIHSLALALEQHVRLFSMFSNTFALNKIHFPSLGASCKHLLKLASFVILLNLVVLGIDILYVELQILYFFLV